MNLQELTDDELMAEIVRLGRPDVYEDARAAIQEAIDRGGLDWTEQKGCVWRVGRALCDTPSVPVED